MVLAWYRIDCGKAERLVVMYVGREWDCNLEWDLLEN